MPFGDKTGPSGQGARTGRGLGNCNGQGGAGIGVGRGAGRGLGRGRGAGRGLGRGLGINANTTQGNSWLETQLNNLQTAIEKLTEQLDKDK